MSKGKPRLNLEGQVFGFLIVKNFYGSSKSGILWNCQCICGKEVQALTANLRRGTTKSCGCKKGYLLSLKTALPPEELAYRTIFNDYKSGAKTRSLDFSLSYDIFKKLVMSDCFYCGIKPSQMKKAENGLGTAIIFYNGIDRQDNNIGYLISNCVSACKMCNYIKSNYDYNAFIEWLDRITRFRKNKI